uniref:Uncharacterized protein n=1 Tax=Lepeophtheirus salmonis TaxID=72036 RepID=A0A0K2UKY1_LEPSM
MPYLLIQSQRESQHGRLLQSPQAPCRVMVEEHVLRDNYVFTQVSALASTSKKVQHIWR